MRRDRLLSAHGAFGRKQESSEPVGGEGMCRDDGVAQMTSDRLKPWLAAQVQDPWSPQLPAAHHRPRTATTPDRRRHGHRAPSGNLANERLTTVGSKARCLTPYAMSQCSTMCHVVNECGGTTKTPLISATARPVTPVPATSSLHGRSKLLPTRIGWSATLTREAGSVTPGSSGTRLALGSSSP
jgi:hypothetical protein